MNSESVELYFVKERANSVGKLRCQHSNGETLSKAIWQPYRMSENKNSCVQ